MITIYSHRHRASGKRYIGQTKLLVEQRWALHVKGAKNPRRGCRVFHAAIRKYGPEAFEAEVLEVVGTRDEANRAERDWIHFFKSRVPNGYNLAPGGDAHDVHEETRQLLRQCMGKIALEREARKTPEERSAVALRRWAKRTPEERAVIAAKVQSQITPEKRQAATAKRLTPETRQSMSKGIRASWSKRTPEERAATAHKQSLIKLGLLEPRRRKHA